MEASGRGGIWRRVYEAPAKIWDHGLENAALFYAERLHERWRDRRLGIGTCAYASRARLGYGQEYNEYEPATYRALDLLFQHCRPTPGQDVFLDYGCGLGRALLCAATRPFKRVIGVELSPLLSDGARLNAERAGPRLRCPVDIHSGDATCYELPDDVSLVYLFNPFRGAPLVQVLDRIQASLRRRPRDLTIAYQRGSNGCSALDDCPWLSLETDLPVPGVRYRIARRDMRLRLYRARPQASTPC